MCSGNDTTANLAICERLVGQAAESGAKLVVLPENFAFLGEREREKFPIAEPVGTGEKPGPIVQRLADMATAHGLWIIGGGMAEVPAAMADASNRNDLARTHNACVAVSPNGEIAAVYRKIHLFDVDIPGGATLRESDTTAPGNELVSLETPLAQIGLSVCYDLRFPELYRDLAVKHGAQVIVVPSAFTAFTGAAHWHVLLRSRAIENQCYVIAAAQFGRHNARRESYGHSLIVDPWGTITAEVTEDAEGMAVAEIDLDHLEQTRERMPCMKHQVLLG